MNKRLIISFICAFLISSVANSADPMRPPNAQKKSMDQVARQPQKILNLQQIMISKDIRKAVINGDVINEGQIKKGIRLVKVKKTGVVIFYAGSQRELSLINVTKSSTEQGSM